MKEKRFPTPPPTDELAVRANCYSLSRMLSRRRRPERHPRSPCLACGGIRDDATSIASSFQPPLVHTWASCAEMCAHTHRTAAAQDLEAQGHHPHIMRVGVESWRSERENL